MNHTPYLLRSVLVNSLLGKGKKIHIKIIYFEIFLLKRQWSALCAVKYDLSIQTFILYIFIFVKVLRLLVSLEILSLKKGKGIQTCMEKTFRDQT
jgi:hypothetical protein